MAENTSKNAETKAELVRWVGGWCRFAANYFAHRHFAQSGASY